jgi:methyl-accepting chemotaxis protein
MSLLKLKIRGRLFAGFGLLIALTVALVAMVVVQFDGIRTDLGGVLARSQNALRTADLAIDMQAIRRGLLRYIHDQDEPSIAEVARRIDNAEATLQAAARAAITEERRATFLRLAGETAKLREVQAATRATIASYAKSRQMLFDEGDRLTAAVRRLAVAAEMLPLATQAGRIESDVLLVRIANWRFLATKDPRGIATFEAAVRKAEQEIGRVDRTDQPAEVRAALDAAGASLKAYKEAFAAAARDLTAADDMYYKTIVPQSTRLGEEFDGLKASIAQTSAQAAAAIEASVATSAWWARIAGAAAVVLGLAIAWLIGNAIVRPIVAMVGAMTKLSAGDTAVTVPGLGRADEVGAMAEAVEVFRAGMIEAARLRAEQAERDAAAAAQRAADMRRLADEFEQAVGGIIQTVSAASSQLQSSAGSLTETARRSQEITTTVASASEEATANVQTVATATEELTTSVQEISRQVQKSTRIAGDAVSQARSTHERIGVLAGAAAKIGDVVELINTIAGQTNLLALNATIEAARAGDAGRGFAVVATEVKALAQQTANATGEIGQQIAAMQQATQDSVAAIEEIGTTIAEISEIAATIAAAVEQQGAATAEIARNIQQAATGTREVSHSIVEAERGASATGSASAQVLDAATSLSRDSTKLREQVDAFLGNVRAA